MPPVPSLAEPAACPLLLQAEGLGPARMYYNILEGSSGKYGMFKVTVDGRYQAARLLHM